MKTASQIAKIMAADVDEFRAAFKVTAELFDALRPGNVRTELIRRNQKVRRAIEALPRRVFERQPFIGKADAERKVSEELAIILKLMDAVQAVFTSMDGDAYDRGEEQDIKTI
jgi:hypothetical protein